MKERVEQATKPRNATDRDKAILYLYKMINDEEDCILKIKLEIKLLEDEVNNLNKTKEASDIKKDSNYSLFSPIYNAETILNNERIQKSLIDIEIKKGELEKQLYAKRETIENYNLIKNCLLIENTKDMAEDSAKAKLDESINKEGINKQLSDQEIRFKFLEIQEFERSRIARDLHDSTVQNLTNLVHKTELCTRLLDVDIIRARLELLTMTNTLRAVINDMRNTIYNLRPMSINDLGLSVTIERMLNTIKENTKINTSLKIINEEKCASQVFNLTLFRIIQEACNNIMKHANADRIVVTLNYEKESIVIEIVDNGKGFQCEIKPEGQEEKEGYGLGLSIMKERVLLLSGELTIDTQEGKGTKLFIKVPFNNKKEEENVSN